MSTAGRGQAAQITGTLVGERGHLYSFRVQATDRVSNAGAWAETSVKAVIAKGEILLCRRRRRLPIAAACDRMGGG